MKPETTRISRMYRWILLAFIFMAAVYLASFLPDADWHATYYPIGRSILTGAPLYENESFRYPPWTALILVPFAILPFNLSRGLAFVLSLLSIGFVSYRLGNNPRTTIFFLLSPTVIGSIIAANIESLLYPAIFLPPTWSLFGLLIKPQIGIGVALYIFITSLIERDIKKLIIALAPVTIGYLISIVVFPLFINRFLNSSNSFEVWNRSIFPYGIPFGLMFLWLAIRKKNMYYALAASPFFSPYLNFYSYMAVQIGLLNEDVENYVRRDILHAGLAVFLWVVMLIVK